MKFVTSLILLLSAQATSAGLIEISYRDQQEHARAVAETLTMDYGIPSEMIEVIWQNNACSPRGESKWHLCLSDSGDLEEVAAEEWFLRVGLKVFQQP